MNKKSILTTVLIAVALFATVSAVRAESAFDEAPTPVRTQSPVYPEALRRENVSGMVSLKVAVDANGDVTEAVVAKSSNALFDKPALDAVARWKFKPAKKAGTAVAVSIMLPLRFDVAQ